MAAMRVTPGRDGYKILFSENTLIMNYKFSAAAAKYGTKENRIMRNIRHDFPGLSEVVVSGRQQASAKANTRLTYENMETHIRAYSNADDLLEVFRTVQALSKSCASPYKYVRDWFLVQFPDYKKPVVFQNGQLAVAPVAAPKSGVRTQVHKNGREFMIYGYARVSTATQGRDGNSLEEQVSALEKYGCQEIVQEAFTGKTMERPKFQELLEALREGDTLVVCKLDRFARTAIEQ